MKSKQSIILTDNSYIPSSASSNIYIDYKDIDNSFYNTAKSFNLNIEDQSKVKILFLLQTTPNPRLLIKFLDSLLAIEGEYEIILVESQAHSGFFRSIQQIKYEFSVATNGRYYLTKSESKDGTLKLKYIKKSPTLLINDSIDKWSFGIVSGGQNNSWVIDLINSIIEQKIPDYEILLCGPSPYPYKEDEPRQLRILSDHLINNDIRAPIAFKKNKIIKEALNNNICILHDRYILPQEWFLNFKKFGNYFDVLCLKNLSIEGNRFSVDWMKFYFPLNSRFKINRALNYDQWHFEAIIPGGAMVLKKNLVEDYLFDERLFWDELEDMQISKMAYLNGVLISIDKNNFFISREVRHKTHKGGVRFLKIIQIYNWIKALIKDFLKYRKKVNSYKDV
jgi:hypothetical protein